ncbi:MAG: alanine racemase [Deltaproteobacteria bacterium]
MPFSSLNRIEVNLSAIRQNFRAIASLHGLETSRLMAVVKSDGYGHGMVEVSRLLVAEGAWGLAIFDLSEGERLRSNGISARIFLLSGFPLGDEEGIMALGLIPGVTQRAQLHALEKEAARRKARCEIHLKADTGMGRMGFEPEEITEIVKARGEWPHLAFAGLYTHLSSADDPEDPETRRQIDVFARLVATVRRLGWDPPFLHAANSAGLIHFPESIYSIARIGLAIYGAYPGEKAKEKIALQPAMSFKSRIVEIRSSPPGSPVSYGHRFRCARASRIAVLPVGYDDGYFRSLSGSARVIIRGRPRPVLGNICMKALMVDVTDAPAAEVGDEAVLLGRQEGEEITLEELAEWSGTISYEVMCSLGTRNTRYHKGS